MTAASIVASLLLAGGTVPPPPVAVVRPRVIEVGAFYRGANVRVEGVAAPGTDVIVTITGSDRQERFNRKGRFGPIWLNTGKVRISGAPSLFLEYSAQPVGTLLGGDAVRRLGLDAASLADRIRIEPRSADARHEAALRADYLALRKDDGVYGFEGRGVAMGPPCDRGTHFSLDLHWPAAAPPAEYQVHVYEVRDHEVLRETCVPLPVVRTGFPAWLAGMAENSASEYGIAAVLIGVLAGFAIDFLTTHLVGRRRRERARAMVVSRSR